MSLIQSSLASRIANRALYGHKPSAPEDVRLITLNFSENFSDRSRRYEVKDMPTTVAVGPIESPLSVSRGELHSRDALSRPFGIGILAPRWTAFDNRHRIAPNVYFHSDLILKIGWNHLFGILANLELCGNLVFDALKCGAD
jgi:hypothetical protein